MARYTGPKHKLARREGINVLDKQSNSLLRRLNTPPGVQGKKRKRKLSEFGLQLREKQKAKVIYGILEKQFKRMVNNVANKTGDTGELLLSLLETRLDNVVYRLGFARSRFMARQLVSHGHIFVNGKRLSIPSYQVQIDDTISLSPKIQSNKNLAPLIAETPTLLPFLERKAVVGKLVRMPQGSDIEVPFNTQQIIEYYSR
ncbi:MAG TPA: 30S ribosomal protein S4 [Patescibacteria group bacterium]|nr:30S ribosomal protein S4 [Patescibacteria group bacterium]